MEIFYHGLYLEPYASDDSVTGVSTDCTMFSTYKNRCYHVFYEKNKELWGTKAMSFQIWEEDHDKAVRQIKQLHDMDPTVYVGIPLFTTEGNMNERLIRYMVNQKIPMNIKGIFTTDHVRIVHPYVSASTSPVLLSIAAGSMSSLGMDPVPCVRYAVQLFKKHSSVRILWERGNDLHSIQRAQELGCHVISVPDSVLAKRKQQPMTMEEAALEYITKQRRDAVDGFLSIRM